MWRELHAGALLKGAAAVLISLREFDATWAFSQNLKP